MCDSDLQRVVKAVAERRRQHARVDKDLVLESQDSDDWNPVFFYGLGHALKHKARRWSCHEPAECTNPSEAMPMPDPVRPWQTMGWADEFFWLAVWRHTGKLRGTPDLKGMDRIGLLYQALVQFEWGDLIREARHYYVKESGKGEREQEGWTEFELWRTARERPLDQVLAERAYQRFGTARQAIRDLSKKPTKGAVDSSWQVAIEDIHRHLLLGLARIRKHLDEPEYALGDLQLAEKVTTRTDEKEILDGLISRLKNDSTTDLEREFQDRKRESADELTPIHILAGWIEDLLWNQKDILHPRLSLPKTPPWDRDVTTFPNKDRIERIESLLREHRDWLRFVTSRDGEFQHKVYDITRRDRQLRAVVTAAEPRPSDQDEDDAELIYTEEVRKSIRPDISANNSWELLVLRDWGSYTPLLPSTREQSSSASQEGGGGCFLRYGRLGIVIDPGYDFIEHFFAAGLKPSDVTHIIVTHDHYDHASSLGPLLNLLHLFHREIEKAGGAASRETRKVSFLLPRNVLDQYARFVVDFGFFGAVEPLTDKDADAGRKHILQANPRLEVVATQTRHADANGFGAGVGLVFLFKDGQLPNLGITGDTGWFKVEKAEQHKEQDGGDGSNRSGRSDLGSLFEKYKPRVMLLHVGSLRSEELRDSTFYRTHLGARGVFRCVASIPSCRLAVLTEFGEECRGNRAWFSERIEEYFRAVRRGFRCIPADRQTRIVATAKGELFVGHGKSIPLAPYERVKVEEGPSCAQSVPDPPRRRAKHRKRH